MNSLVGGPVAFGNRVYSVGSSIDLLVAPERLIDNHRSAAIERLRRAVSDSTRPMRSNERPPGGEMSVCGFDQLRPLPFIEVADQFD
jgi:hypothetical protein